MCRAKNESGRRCKSSTPAYRRAKRIEKQRLAAAAVEGTPAPAAPVFDRDYFVALGRTENGPRPLWNPSRLADAAEFLNRNVDDDTTYEGEVIAWTAIEIVGNHTRTGKVTAHKTAKEWMETGLSLQRALDWRDALTGAGRAFPDARVREVVVEYEREGVSPADLTADDLAWTRAGVPRADREGWNQFLTKYPRRSLFFPSGELAEHRQPMLEAAAAVERGDIEDTEDARATYAWEYLRNERPHYYSKASGLDGLAAYLRVGGTLEEARGFQAAFEAWAQREGSPWRYNLPYIDFDDKEYRRLRALKVSPEMLHAWVVNGGDPRYPEKVGETAKWARRVCRDAPPSLALLYKSVANDDAEVREWEKRRKAGENLRPQLEMLRALAPAA